MKKIPFGNKGNDWLPARGARPQPREEVWEGHLPLAVGTQEEFLPGSGPECKPLSEKNALAGPLPERKPGPSRAAGRGRRRPPAAPAWKSQAPLPKKRLSACRRGAPARPPAPAGLRLDLLSETRSWKPPSALRWLPG